MTRCGVGKASETFLWRYRTTCMRHTCVGLAIFLHACIQKVQPVISAEMSQHIWSFLMQIYNSGWLNTDCPHLQSLTCTLVSPSKKSNQPQSPHFSSRMSLCVRPEQIPYPPKCTSLYGLLKEGKKLHDISYVTEPGP